MKHLMFSGLLAAILGAVFALAPGLQAATLTVTNADDDGPGSLREAIYLASSGDEIQFDPGLAGNPIVLTTGELLIDKNLTITGLGQDQTIVDGNASSRVFRIGDGVTGTIANLTIRNGLEGEYVSGPSGDGVIGEGGGIYNSGTLILNDSSVRSNTISALVCDDYRCFYASAISARGGGIYNSGTATLNHCRIENNKVDAFGYSFGGGVYNAGPISLVATYVVENSGLSDRYSGVKGLGLFNDTAGTMVIVEGSVIGNSYASSQAIVNQGLLTMTGTTVAGNKGWRGGALFNTGTATLTDSSVVYNETWAGGGNWGEAGGITNYGSLTLVRLNISGNLSLGHGGIANKAGTARIVNSTIGDNDGYMGVGGVSAGAMTIVENSTIAGNIGGGISAASGTVFKGSVIAGNVDRSFPPLPEDCRGSVTSQGNNILGEGSYCQGFGSNLNGDVVGTDWTQLLESRNDYWSGLVPLLADNGGPTNTVALIPGSLAIDAITPDACTDTDGNPITTDQRGVPRPQGEACDIGAFESSLPRGAGFWAHQCSDKGFHQVSPEEMQALFKKIADTSSVFPECSPIGCEALNPQLPRNDLRLRAQQAVLDVWLNLVSGRLTRGRPIDLPDLTSATTVAEALSELEMTVCDPLATRPELANAKDIAEALNGGPDDMELAAQESTVTLLPGATRTIALGLINMSPGNRDYSLTASGPWPVQLSATLINALDSGEVAQITATITAPQDEQATTAQIRITATDLLTQGTLSRDVTITLTLAAGSPPK